MNRTLLLFICLPLVQIVCAQSQYIYEVDEYVPAPGQFTNVLPPYEDGDDEQSMVRKCTELLAGNNNGMITLGAYGGYVTFHFDHRVINIQGEKDIYLKGNAFEGNSEPGIVMVSQDLNNNGLPDDVWFELSGSADVDSLDKVVYGYEITYTYSPMNDIPWIDNMGNSGTVDRNSFHKQEYYPEWISEELSFRGTLLPSNICISGANYILNSYGYGYVDNKPNSDRDACSVDISDAVDPFTRKKVVLDYVDFVRVYNAMNQKAGRIGETSTEFCGAEDLHPNVSATRDLVEECIGQECYIDLCGRVYYCKPMNGGVFIQRSGYGKSRKVVF